MIYSHLCNTKCNTRAKNIDKSTVLQGFDSPRLHHLKKPCNARLLCFIPLYFKAFAPFLIPNPEYIFQEKILFSEKMQHEMQHEYNIKNTLKDNPFKVFFYRFTLLSNKPLFTNLLHDINNVLAVYFPIVVNIKFRACLSVSHGFHFSNNIFRIHSSVSVDIIL